MTPWEQRLGAGLVLQLEPRLGVGPAGGCLKPGAAARSGAGIQCARSGPDLQLGPGSRAGVAGAGAGLGGATSPRPMGAGLGLPGPPQRFLCAPLGEQDPQPEDHWPKE